MDKRIERLREWGCDIKGALERMLGDENFYIECLNIVVTDSTFDEMKAAIEANDVEKAFNCTHTLKGVLANVGLTPMYNKTIELVEPLRSGDCRCDALIPAVNSLMQMKSHLEEILK